MGAEEPKPKVLVIDDELGPRESLRVLLNREYIVHLASSVDDGVKHLQEETPDVIIMDIKMPVKNGIQGLKEIREIDPDVSIIMLTGFGALETAQEAIRMGASDYIKKPFDAPDMLNAISRNIKKSQYQLRKKQTLDQLAELNKNLTEELENKGRMADIGLASAEFAHDIRNPLTIVIGYVGLLAQQLGDAKDTVTDDSSGTINYLTIIEKNVRRCHELSQSWTRLSRNEPVCVQRVNISSTIEDIVKGAETLASQRGAHLVAEIESDRCEVMADDIQIFRAVSNLVINAIEALPETDGVVKVACARNNGHVEIRVQDNGCGMDEEKLTKIFDANYTSDKENGTGLGLFIAKRVVGDHRGQIRVESSEEHGTTFIIELPALAEQELAS